MPTLHGTQLATDQERNEAAWIGMVGGLVGACRWGFYSAILAAGGYYFSPVYRGLTLQFKVYLQMSGMTIGGCLEADRRVRDYERSYRRIRKAKKDAEVWQRYEQQYAYQEARNAAAAAGKPEPEAVVKNE